jgi:hypothetical protein
MSVRYKMRESFLAQHSGYQIKEILQEYWDEIELPFVLRGWGKLRTDYADHCARSTPTTRRRTRSIGSCDRSSCS